MNRTVWIFLRTNGARPGPRNAATTSSQAEEGPRMPAGGIRNGQPKPSVYKLTCVNFMPKGRTTDPQPRRSMGTLLG